MASEQPKSQAPAEPLWRRAVDVLWRYPPAERKKQQKRRRERAQAGLKASSSRVKELSEIFVLQGIGLLSAGLLSGMMSVLPFAGPVGALGITLGFLIIYICFTLGVLVMLVAPIFDWGVPKSLVVSHSGRRSARSGIDVCAIPENLRHG